MPITLVKAVMTDVVGTLRVGDNLDLAKHLMKAGRIRRLPVIDGNEHLVGLLVLSPKSWWAPRMARTLRSTDKM